MADLAATGSGFLEAIFGPDHETIARNLANQSIEDAILRARVVDARLDAAVREKLAQIAGAMGRSEAMKREAEELERDVESLKRTRQ